RSTSFHSIRGPAPGTSARTGRESRNFPKSSAMPAMPRRCARRAGATFWPLAASSRARAKSSPRASGWRCGRWRWPIERDRLGRPLLRFVLVPLGYCVAVVATLIIVLGSWKLGAAATHPDTQAFAIFGFVFAAPVLLIMLLSLMWLPAAIGILISEA